MSVSESGKRKAEVGSSSEAESRKTEVRRCLTCVAKPPVEGNSLHSAARGYVEGVWMHAERFPAGVR